MIYVAHVICVGPLLYEVPWYTCFMQGISRRQATAVGSTEDDLQLQQIELWSDECTQRLDGFAAAVPSSLPIQFPPVRFFSVIQSNGVIPGTYYTFS